MKFGGTSVGDASCIGRVVEIVRTASRLSNIVVVVSAMTGVTDKLIEAATLSERGDRKSTAAIFQKLREQHEAAIVLLVQSNPERNRIRSKMEELLRAGERLCQATALRRELSLRTRDSVSGLGERLSAPLVAAALAERGVNSKPIEATELIVTDSNHGAAQPRMPMTRQRCQAHLHPLLRQGIVPVVTGFIGANEESVLTTLGRGGSDYSATILGAALDANQVIIWKDVDGVLTADPRLVPGTRTIPEISYREAADLASFGAKVLHPKTLQAVAQYGIPVWIRNTFAPERPGTRITAEGFPEECRVKGISAISDVALIIVAGQDIAKARSAFRRIVAANAAIRSAVKMVLSSFFHDTIGIVVPAQTGEAILAALRPLFSQNFADGEVCRLSLHPTVAVVTIVGQNMHGAAGTSRRALDALDREAIALIAAEKGCSKCNISLVVEQRDMKRAIVTVHQEFNLGAPISPSFAPQSDGAFSDTRQTPAREGSI
ncbi:MAG: aspartate kinase [Candidatus Acidiferrales bacterium]